MDLGEVQEPDCKDFQWGVSFFPNLKELLTSDQYLAMDSIVAVLGDRGVGKTSVVNAIMKEDEHRAKAGRRRYYNRIIETMTRRPRENEVEGVHMRYMDEASFLQRLELDQELHRRVREKRADLSVERPHFLGAYYVWEPGSPIRKLAGVALDDFTSSLDRTIQTGQVNIFITAVQVVVETLLEYDFLKVLLIETERKHQRAFLLKRGDDPEYVAGNPMGPGDMGFSFPMQRILRNKPRGFAELKAEVSKLTRYAPLTTYLPLIRELEIRKRQERQVSRGEMNDPPSEGDTRSQLLAA